MALALLLARWLAARPDPRLATPAGPGAAVAVALVLGVTSLLLWVANPYAGLMLVPAAHLWLLALLLAGPPPRRLRALLLGLGALPPLLVTIYYLFALSIDPLGGRLVPAPAGDRPRRRARHRLRRLRHARHAVRGGRARVPPARGGAARESRRRRARRCTGRAPTRGPARWAGPSRRSEGSPGRPAALSRGWGGDADARSAGWAKGTFSTGEHNNRRHPRRARQAGAIRGERACGRGGDDPALEGRHVTRARSRSGPRPPGRRGRSRASPRPAATSPSQVTGAAASAASRRSGGTVTSSS